MNQLLPIIRRVRRPLPPVDAAPPTARKEATEAPADVEPVSQQPKEPRGKSKQNEKQT